MLPVAFEPRVFLLKNSQWNRIHYTVWLFCLAEKTRTFIRHHKCPRSSSTRQLRQTEALRFVGTGTQSSSVIPPGFRVPFPRLLCRVAWPPVVTIGPVTIGRYGTASPANRFHRRSAAPEIPPPSDQSEHHRGRDLFDPGEHGDCTNTTNTRKSRTMPIIIA